LQCTDFRERLGGTVRWTNVDVELLLGERLTDRQMKWVAIRVAEFVENHNPRHLIAAAAPLRRIHIGALAGRRQLDDQLSPAHGLPR
jgi:hypothetical protein